MFVYYVRDFRVGVYREFSVSLVYLNPQTPVGSQLKLRLFVVC